MAEAKLVDSKVIYGFSYGMAYLCKPCDAYVGCHKGTNVPLGTLANAELREWRKKAHNLFDKIWRDYLPENMRHIYRSRCYSWLSKKMNVPYEQCHIAMFDVDQCKKVVMLCETEIIQIPDPYEEIPV
jgi:hypothetical protein